MTAGPGPPFLRFGAFVAPFHHPGGNPTLALERDLELVVLLDSLGFDEAWVGEHHSAGVEIIASPEVFIATAAERTRRIRLGTGVSSLPYHHPLVLADRMVLLDHLTRGRVMLGCGPGALPSDAHMMGIDPSHQRAMMEESLEALLALLDGSRPVSRRGRGFVLQDARLQLRPYSRPRFEVVVAAQVSPAGPRAAGRFGLGLLSIGATSLGGFDALTHHWAIVEERAAAHGQAADRASWRLVGPVHVAETEAQARRDVARGLPRWVDYFRRVAALPLAPDTDEPDQLVDAMNDSGLAAIGTPDRVAAQIERLLDHTGGFGAFLAMAHDWAGPAETRRSFELLADEVVPRFQGSAEAPTASRDWAAANRPRFMGAVGGAIAQAFADHHSGAASDGTAPDGTSAPPARPRPDG